MGIRIALASTRVLINDTCSAVTGLIKMAHLAPDDVFTYVFSSVTLCALWTNFLGHFVAEAFTEF